MNHFFALELSEEAQQEATRLSQDWRRLLTPEHKAKWYGPDDYHVTLKFLGDLPEARQPELIAAAAPVAAMTAPFTVTLAPAGAFPSLQRPNVLWAGVEASPALADLPARLEEAMASIGFPREGRPYRPHVTVARCRPSNGVGEWPAPSERLFPDWTATRFVLMQTLPPDVRAKEGKARYNTVQAFPFGNTQS